MTGQMYRDLVASGKKMTKTEWRRWGFKPKTGEKPELGNSTNSFTWSHLYTAGQMVRVKKRI